MSVERRAKTNSINQLCSILRCAEWDKVRLEFLRNRRNLNRGTKREREFERARQLTAYAIHARRHCSTSSRIDVGGLFTGQSFSFQWRALRGILETNETLTLFSPFTRRVFGKQTTTNNRRNGETNRREETNLRCCFPQLSEQNDDASGKLFDKWIAAADEISSSLSSFFPFWSSKERIKRGREYRYDTNWRHHLSHWNKENRKEKKFHSFSLSNRRISTNNDRGRWRTVDDAKKKGKMAPVIRQRKAEHPRTKVLRLLKKKNVSAD